MPCILPVSDLRNYNEVLQNVSEGSPVFLTKNGRGCFVVIDIKEYERLTAEHKLQKSLEEGEQSAKESGWLAAADVRAKYEV
ncbi:MULTISPECIES: type II toxin-antitoxin system prevent-host-death family antitoxin [unclassified Fibrobacter]|uniref:type II toxin-antitoxin system prevent-host-death family antitoxin n=1 Tax=unclassified Fibrobacter TaxID=2634177 RepID=UPI000D6C388C|nr:MULTISPECIES: type II toxin-antitoxin system prevent-host-death family antitoxin [unclassified Fibrobacter]MCQ2123446.1 type II toxin-antitoxin system prevent-host-death family antitoxin [Fibrobacter sp.]PWJ66257.1 prevent-host-death family protein [Fibrobacter sp. UWR4]PZW69461.1 prevent-host-death family protein [Fibrobacter sp. UWR1]